MHCDSLHAVFLWIDHPVQIETLRVSEKSPNPIVSMISINGIVAYIYHTNQPNVGDFYGKLVGNFSVQSHGSV